MNGHPLDIIRQQDNELFNQVETTREMALKEIAQNRGLLYEADVVDACVKLLTEKKFSFRQ